MFDPYIIVALVVSVTIHEFCHAWMSTYLGDPTARYLGRLSLNPLSHLDPLGTLMLLFAGFGWGKPVPFSMQYLKNPRLDAAMIALSGPLSNLLIALIFAIPYRYLFFQVADMSSENALFLGIFRFMKTMIELNLVLMVFNMLPIPPLDGSKVFSLFLPGDWLSRLYQYRHFGYGLLLVLVFSDYLFGVNILGQYILLPIVELFWEVLLFST